ncbi:MAG: bifunctional nuclease family protein, partial [Chlamydiales bacterium]|nr:bifunctional nuclease family protein [Chlamydiales bacterium]
MSPELVLITFNKIMQSHSYTVIILGTEQKRFAIYTEPQVGKNIQFFLTAEQRIRPLTHDLIHAVWKGLDVKPLHI